MADVSKKGLEVPQNASKAILSVWLGGVDGSEIHELLNEYRTTLGITWKEFILGSILVYVMQNKGEYNEVLASRLIEYLSQPNLKTGRKSK